MNRAAEGVPAKYAVFVGAAALLAGTALYVSHKAKQAERRHPPDGKFIEIQGVRLHYREAGSGPAVILLHGNGATSEDFAISGLFGTLAESCRVIAFDRPGYGYSTRPRSTLWTPAAQARLLLQAMAALGVKRPVLVGHSWGTLVAVAMALESPVPPAGLALLAGYYYPTARADVPLLSPPALPIIGDIMRYTISPLLGRAFAVKLSRKLFAPAAVPPRFISEYPLGLALRPLQLRASAEESAMMIPAALQFRKRYAEIRCPVAIVAGEGDEIVNFGRQSARLHRELPGSALHRVAGVGHMVHYAAVADIAAAVLGMTSARRPRAAAREWLSRYETDGNGHSREENRLDQSMADSFPASDPPAFMGSAIAGSPRRSAR